MSSFVCTARIIVCGILAMHGAQEAPQSTLDEAPQDLMSPKDIKALISPCPFDVFLDVEKLGTWADAYALELQGTCANPIFAFLDIFYSNQELITEFAQKYRFLSDINAYNRLPYPDLYSSPAKAFVPLFNLLLLIGHVQSPPQEADLFIKSCLDQGHVPAEHEFVSASLAVIHTILTTTNLKVSILLLKEENDQLQSSMLTNIIALRNRTLLLTLSKTFSKTHLCHAEGHQFMGIPSIVLVKNVLGRFSKILTGEQTGLATMGPSGGYAFMECHANFLWDQFINRKITLPINASSANARCCELLCLYHRLHESAIIIPETDYHAAVQSNDTRFHQLFSKASHTPQPFLLLKKCIASLPTFAYPKLLTLHTKAIAHWFPTRKGCWICATDLREIFLCIFNAASHKLCSLLNDKRAENGLGALIDWASMLHTKSTFVSLFLHDSTLFCPLASKSSGELIILCPSEAFIHSLTRPSDCMTVLTCCQKFNDSIIQYCEKGFCLLNEKKLLQESEIILRDIIHSLKTAKKPRSLNPARLRL